MQFSFSIFEVIPFLNYPALKVMIYYLFNDKHKTYTIT